MIGCELPLDHSRALARRSRTRDWQPLTEAEWDASRWNRAKWNDCGRASWTPFEGPTVPSRG